MPPSIDSAKVQRARAESIHPSNSEAFSIVPGVQARQFASKACGARGFSTGTASFEPGAVLPYHTHPFSEAIAILSGEAQVAVDGRLYHLSQFDCIHVPAGVAHEVKNRLQDYAMVAFCAFGSDTPRREFVSNTFAVQERGLANPKPNEPEHITRFTQAERYELSPGADFQDLFAGRFGSVGICGGYGRFKPGASLPCHIHKFDESITIVEGNAICLVKGKRYLVSDYDTAFVPEGHPHRFLNESEKAMAMIWVYAGSEPERTLVDAGYCSGTILWPQADN